MALLPEPYKSMMSHATFYLIPPNTQEATSEGFLGYVLYLTQHFANQGAKLYLHCEHRQQAEAMAERLWQVPPEQFIAHNLVGEGPHYGTPIEIGFQTVQPSTNRHLVINLANCKTTFADRFMEVVDFVPCEENEKQMARERYKIYRQSGYQLQTMDIQNTNN